MSSAIVCPPSCCQCHCQPRVIEIVVLVFVGYIEMTGIQKHRNFSVIASCLVVGRPAKYFLSRWIICSALDCGIMSKSHISRKLTRTRLDTEQRRGSPSQCGISWVTTSTTLWPKLLSRATKFPSEKDSEHRHILYCGNEHFITQTIRWSVVI